MAHRAVLMIIAHEGYQPIEYTIAKKTLEHAGFRIVTASNKPGMATATDKSHAQVNLLIQDAIAADYEALVVIGGPGTLDNLDNQITYQLLTQADDLGILVAAICIAPRILAHANLLADGVATGWDGDDQLGEIYEEYGVTYIQAPVVTYQNIITAADPAAAQEFADTILKYLKK